MSVVVRKANRLANRASVWLYRRTNGKAGGHGTDRLPVLLLTVPGRKSGVPHTVPVDYFEHGGGYVVVGTGMGGSKGTPQWFLNLKAAGGGRIRILDREREVAARVTDGTERDQLWTQVAARAPHFAKYQQRAGRTVPIAVLTTQSREGRPR